MLEALHVGCGPAVLPGALFPREEWREIRLDIDADARPDVVASMTEIPLADEIVSAVYSAHNLEHLAPHEVPVALAEFRRVLRPGGFVLVGVPDIQQAAEWIARGDGDAVAYVAPCGDVTPLDIVFGHAGMRASNPFMAHRGGFTAATLGRALGQAGLMLRSVEVRGWDIWGLAAKEPA